MSEAARSSMTPDAFLAWEPLQIERHHFVRGEVFAMAGGSPRHSYLAGRIQRAHRQRPSRPRYDAHTSDLRLGLAGDHFAYADAVVVCRPVILRPEARDVVTNPTVVVEVLSKATKAYDRGDKQAGYLALPSLEHFVFVSQRQPRVEIYTHQKDGSFRFDVHAPGSVIRLGHLAVEIPIDDLYAVAFELPATTAETRLMPQGRKLRHIELYKYGEPDQRISRIFGRSNVSPSTSTRSRGQPSMAVRISGPCSPTRIVSSLLVPAIDGLKA